MNSGLDENQSELGVLVLAVALEMLSYGNSLFDKHVQVFRNLRCQTFSLKDAKNLVSGHDLDLGDSMRVTEDDTDLRGSCALLC